MAVSPLRMLPGAPLIGILPNGASDRRIEDGRASRAIQDGSNWSRRGFINPGRSAPVRMRDGSRDLRFFLSAQVVLPTIIISTMKPGGSKRRPCPRCHSSRTTRLPHRERRERRIESLSLQRVRAYMDGTEGREIFAAGGVRMRCPGPVLRAASAFVTTRSSPRHDQVLCIGARFVVWNSCWTRTPTN
jgi:hypothetical protein